MRSTLSARGIIEIRKSIANDHAVTLRKSGHNTFENVIDWPEDTAIPNVLSDWLVFLIMHKIFDKVKTELKDGEVYTIRYDLGKFLITRGVTALLTEYPQYVTILRVTEESYNIWVDGKLTAFIRNGTAYGKGIFVRNYDRNLYKNSRALATQTEDIMAALSLFPHAKRHIILDYD